MESLIIMHISYLWCVFNNQVCKKAAAAFKILVYCQASLKFKNASAVLQLVSTVQYPAWNYYSPICLQPVSSRLICLPSPPASYQLLFYIFFNNAYIHLLHLLKNSKAFVYSAYQIHIDCTIEQCLISIQFN